MNGTTAVTTARKKGRNGTVSKAVPTACKKREERMGQYQQRVKREEVGQCQQQRGGDKRD